MALNIAPKYCESELAQLSDAFVAAFDFRADALCKYLSSSSVSQIPRVWIDSMNSFFIFFVKWYYLLAIEPSVSDLSKINTELPVKDFLTKHNKSIFNLFMCQITWLFSTELTQKEKHCYSLILLGFKSLERQSFISDILRPPSATNSRKFLHLFNVEPPMQIQRRNVRNTHTGRKR